MTPQSMLEHLRQGLPGFAATGKPEPLAGGYLNHVWRVRGHPEPVIVKVAPPYIAAKPEIPLDPHRITIEARSLATFGAGGALAAIGSPAVRPPRLLHFDERHYILVMEDVGECPDLGTWLHQWPRSECSEEDVGLLLGQFIGALHVHSFRDQGLAEVFDNMAIQRTRLEVQYRAIRGLCERAALPDADALGRQAVALGELLQQPGLCVIMGDLWPPSIRVTANGLRLIDWELAHFGRPSQDVGHLAAHLWMHSHRAPTNDAAARARATLQGFLTAYRSALGEKFDELFGADGIRESALHLGAEILVRAVGAFKEGYLYEGSRLDNPQVQEAIAVAADHIRSPESVDTFTALAA